MIDNSLVKKKETINFLRKILEIYLINPKYLGIMLTLVLYLRNLLPFVSSILVYSFMKPFEQSNL